MSPPLLGETLAKVLRAEGLEVVIAESVGAVDEHVDVAIVTDAGPPSLDVPLVIRLPAPSDEGIGTVTRRGHAAETVSLPDLRSVLAAVRWEGAAGR